MADFSHVAGESGQSQAEITQKGGKNWDSGVKKMRFFQISLAQVLFLSTLQAS